MKTLIVFFFLIATTQTASSQACGIYRINYVGQVLTQSSEAISVKLPSIAFLHGLKKNRINGDPFISTTMKQNNIELELTSPLTSILFDEAQIYLEYYKSKNKKLPILIERQKNGVHQEIEIELDWNDIEIEKIAADGLGNCFRINLKKIKLDD